VDLATFYNVYNGLVSLWQHQQPESRVPVGTAIIPWANNLHGETYGGEIFRQRKSGGESPADRKL